MRIQDVRLMAQRAEEEAKAEVSPVSGKTKPLSATAKSALVEQINAEHHACEEAARSSLEHAIRCGELLAEAREIVREEDGKWMTWVKKNFSGSKSTEENYRRLADNKKYLTEPDSQRVANLSIRDALALLVPERGKSDSEEGEGRVTPAAAKKPTQRTGKPRDKSGRGSRVSPCRKKADTRETEVYLGEDLPVERRALEEVFGERRAVALSCDLFAGADAEERLAALREYLDTVARAALDAEGEARLLLLFDTEPESRAVAEQALGCNSEKEAEERRRYERGVLRGADEVEITLYRAVVVERGGVRLPRGGRREEYDKVPLCYLGKNGLPGDEMASELAEQCPHLGVRDEDSLLEALGARRKAAG